MLTHFLKARALTTARRQEYAVFTCDQHLYRFARHIIWNTPPSFLLNYLRLGGMYLLMRFNGSVGVLREDSVL